MNRQKDIDLQEVNTNLDTVSQYYLLHEDTREDAGFLNDSILKEELEIITKCIEKASKSPNKRVLLQTMRNYFTFKKVFSNQGMRGITGLLTLNNKNKKIPVVFKLSSCLNKDVEHEKLVTTELNKLRNFCPHLVGSLGMIKLPISDDFVQDPQRGSIFTSSTTFLPCNVMFMEYVSPISFYHVCKYSYKDQSLIYGLICQVLLALSFAQKHCRLTHFDLHVDNILVRRIDQDAVFLYIVRDKAFLIPTKGFYPVIIDFGCSYIDACESGPMLTTSAEYHNGQQSTLYDNLNDIQHLLLSCLYYLEDKGYCYDWLKQRFMWLFRHVPLLEKKGWKQLPNNILKIVIKKIENSFPVIKKIEVWKELSYNLIELMNPLIQLPWTRDEQKTFTPAILDIVETLQKISELPRIGPGDGILWIMRETVDMINDYKETILIDNKISKDFEKGWFERVGFLTHSRPKINIDLGMLVLNLIETSKIIAANYFDSVQEHVELINESYLRTEIKGPLDAVKIILQNSAVHVDIKTTTPIYIWNADNSQSSFITGDKLSEQDRDKINGTTAHKKGEVLRKIIQNNA